MNNKEEITLERLRRQGALTVDMSEVFVRGNLDALLVSADDAVLLRHKAGMYMLWCADASSGIRALSSAGAAGNECLSSGAAHGAASEPALQKPMECCIVHGRPALEAVLTATRLKPGGACFQYCRHSNEKLPLRGICDIRLLRTEEAPIVVEHYKLITGIDEARALIEAKLLYGAVVDGQLAGFIGWHYDGSAGMLEIFPEYRRRGLGIELECFMHNVHIDRGWTTYGHVFADNIASLKLQEKLGLEVSSDNIWWTFAEGTALAELNLK